MLGWFALAWAQDPVLKLVVTDPSGSVVLEDARPLPFEIVLPGDGHALMIYAAPFEGGRALIDLVTGPMRDGDRPVTRFERSSELEPWVGRVVEVPWKHKGTWSVRAAWGTTWEAPAPEPSAEACEPASGPVLTRALSVRFDDGTGYAVAPGVAATPSGEGRARVSTGGLSFDVGVEPGDVGEAVLDPTGHRYVSGPTPRRLPAGLVGRTTLGEVWFEGAEAIAVTTQPRIDATVVEVRTACASVWLAPPPPTIRIE
ncbi:MAG: hypothetical protein H6738_10725 [Alphaproteobacteria bacterium]|nr:hypothetical protein [Alphaproteobacteria bacterium]MCB9697244.1 hypothetical protein [Alphaproteobacteria bacterium]